MLQLHLDHMSDESDAITQDFIKRRRKEVKCETVNETKCGDKQNRREWIPSQRMKEALEIETTEIES